MNVTHDDFWIGLFLLCSQLWLMCGLFVARDEKRMAVGIALGCAWLGALIFAGVSLS